MEKRQVCGGPGCKGLKEISAFVSHGVTKVVQRVATFLDILPHRPISVGRGVEEE